MAPREFVLASGILLGMAWPTPGLAQPPLVQSQGSTDPRPSSTTVPPDLTTDLRRIREGLSRPDALKLRQEGLRFYLTVLGRRLTVHEYLKNSDLKYGPVPRAGMTHQDFVNHITPQLLYSSGGIKATELLQWGVVNWLGQMAVKKVFSEIGDAMRDAEVRRIREQIDRELAALRGKDNKNH